jgi:hypothetical protein
MYLSMLSVFDLVTQDNYDLSFKYLAVTTGKTWLAAIFVIPVMIIGAFALINLFLAMLLSHMEQMDTVIGTASLTGSMTLNRGVDFGSTRDSDMGSARNSSHTRLLPVATNQIMPEPPNKKATDMPQPSMELDASLLPSDERSSRIHVGHKPVPKVQSLVKIRASIKVQEKSHKDPLLAPGLAGLCPILEGKSLGLMGPHNAVRKWIFDFLRLKILSRFMNAIIILSCIELCFDDVTVEPGSTKERVLQGFNIAFLVIFGLEVS